MRSDLLTQAEFDSHLANNTLRLSFVGMSNAGKSYRSRMLEGAGFFWYDVDREIQRQLGFEDMADISDWLGYPNTKTYPEREREYLDAETKATKIDAIDTKGKNLVFDTTGSVIYTEDDTRAWLHDQCLIVNLDVGENAVHDMLRRFLNEPKPVIWNGFFSPQDGEAEIETIRRAYPALLRDRLVRYRAMAHVTIPASELFDADAETTLSTIRSRLPAV